jgi:hypothetical protein
MPSSGKFYRTLANPSFYISMIDTFRTNSAWRGKPKSFEVAPTCELAALGTLAAIARLKARAAERANEWNYGSRDKSHGFCRR